MSALTWNQICEDRSLANLPYKIETNRYGQIVMSPALDGLVVRLPKEVRNLLEA